MQSVNNGGARPDRERLSVCYRIAKVICAVLFSTVLPVKYHDLEKLQMDAPFILIANHNSGFDPLMVCWRVKRYQVRCLGKKELAKSRLVKAIFKNLRVISVDRHNMDLAALRECIKTLREGHVLCVFPEGTRYKKGVMEDLESGVGMIALKGGTGLVPMYISGKPKFFCTTHVYVGDVISLDDIREGPVDKGACERVMERITHTYRDMVKLHGGS